MLCCPSDMAAAIVSYSLVSAHHSCLWKPSSVRTFWDLSAKGCLGDKPASSESCSVFEQH